MPTTKTNGFIKFAARILDSARQTVASHNDSRLPNALSGSSNAKSSSSNNTQQAVRRRTQRSVHQRTSEQVSTRLNNLLAECNLTIEDLKSIIGVSGFGDGKLISMSDSEFQLLESIIKNSLDYLKNSGQEYTKQDFKVAFATFKFCMLDAKSDERAKTSEEAHAFVKGMENKNVFDLLQEHVNKIMKNPNSQEAKALQSLLKDEKGEIKLVKELEAVQLKTVLASLISAQVSNNNQTPEGVLNFYIVLINRCIDEDKTKFFQGFALLLQDKNFINSISKAYQETALSFVDTNRLIDFINNGGDKVLKALGFNDESILALQHHTLVGIDPDKFNQILLDVYNQISNEFKPEELAVFIKSIALVQAGKNPQEELNEKELTIFNKISECLNGQINILSAAHDRTDLPDTAQNKIRDIYHQYSDLGLADYVYGQLNNIYEQNPDMFVNITSKDDFTKILNMYTDNKFGEVIGDTNPNNRYNPEQKAETSEKNALGYTVPTEEQYNNAVNNVTELSEQLYTDEEQEYVVEANFANRSDVQPQVISQRSAAINGKSFDEAWAQGVIDVQYLAENFSDICSKGIQKVWNFLDINKQNRNEHLVSWHNADLSSEAAERYDMDKDEIEELGLSISRTQVLQNRYDQLHRNEAESNDIV